MMDDIETREEMGVSMRHETRLPTRTHKPRPTHFIEAAVIAYETCAATACFILYIPTSPYIYSALSYTR